MRHSLWKNRMMTVLAMIGFTVASYLTLAHLGIIPLACDIPYFDCGTVSVHPLAYGFGLPLLRHIPTAAFGVLFFVAIAGTSILCALRGTVQFAQLMTVTQFGLTLLGVGAMLLLSAAEAFIIHAWCFWCVITACIVATMAILLLSTRAWTTSKMLFSNSQVADTQWHLAEAGRLAGLFIVGVLASAILLRHVQHVASSPEITSELTRESLRIAECPVIGDAHAPCTLVQFGNYACPHCKASLPEVNRLLQEYQGKLNVVFSPTMRKPDTRFFQLANAAQAAWVVGKYQQMHAALFEQQDTLAEADAQVLPVTLTKVAHTIGIADAQLFTRELATAAFRQQVAKRVQVAKRFHMTPLPRYVFLSPTHPSVVLKSTEQVVQWLHDPRHW